MAKKLKQLSIGGETYDVGYSSNDYDDTAKANMVRLLKKTFPLTITLTANGTTDATSIAERKVAKSFTASWTATVDNVAIDYTAAAGKLTIGTDDPIPLSSEVLNEKKYAVTLTADDTDVASLAISLQITAQGMTNTDKHTISFYYPTYYGYATSVDDLVARATTTATDYTTPTRAILSTGVGTFYSTSVDGSSFYLAIPIGVTAPNSFKLNDFSATLTKETTTIDGISYIVFHTDAVATGKGGNKEKLTSSAT